MCSVRLDRRKQPQGQASEGGSAKPKPRE